MTQENGKTTRKGAKGVWLVVNPVDGSITPHSSETAALRQAVADRADMNYVQYGSKIFPSKSQPVTNEVAQVPGQTTVDEHLGNDSEF